jgi:S1-C subfamily serine protease
MKKIFFLIVSLGLVFSNLSYSEIKLRGSTKGTYKTESRTFQISEEMLNEKIFDNLSDIIKENDEIATSLSENYKIKKEIKLRGPGGGIYSQYADSVFLISNSSGKGTIGSGSLIDSSGLILTNAHVVSGTSTVRVYARPANGKKLADTKIYMGNVLLINPELDLAIVKIFGVNKSTKTIPLGNISDIQIAEEVHAIGHPKGLFWSYTKGVVSQIRPNYKWKTGKKDSRKNHEATVIQTQTPISPGNSGGPLFSDKGKMVGINTMKRVGENLNFAVSVEHAKNIIRSDLLKQKVKEAKPTNKINWIESKYPNAQASDHNKNGVVDTWYIDKNKDGKIDRAYLDENENGKIDGILVDKNQNGKWELILIDKNEDGKIDYGIIDKDEDGKPDLVAYDDNGDKKWDRYEKLKS